MLAVVACAVCFDAVHATANATGNATAQTYNATQCMDWSPKVMRALETMLGKTSPSDSEKSDLQGFRTHNAMQLRWAKAHTNAARETELTTGACGHFDKRIETKLGDASAGGRRAASHSVAALLSLLALARISAAY